MTHIPLCPICGNIMSVGRAGIVSSPYHHVINKTEPHAFVCSEKYHHKVVMDLKERILCYQIVFGDTFDDYMYSREMCIQMGLIHL